MKKSIITSALLAATIVFSGCLKDKGFENHEYGINRPQSSPAGVGFPWAYAAEYNLTSINVSTSPQTAEAPIVGLFTDQPAPQDITVNLVANQALVAAWNAAHPSDQLATFPAGAYSIPSLKVTIPKGERLGSLKITIPTTNGLSFSDKYGLGFSIASVDQPGITIAENLKNVVIAINVANQYAGSYDTDGYFFHPSAPRGMKDIKDLGTVSANQCRAGLGDLYTANYYFDFTISGSNLTNWVPVGATPSGPQSGFMTMDVPNPGGINPYPASGPKPGQAPWLHSTYNNTYDAAHKTFWMHYGYGVNATNQNGWTRQVYERWVKR